MSVKQPPEILSLFIRRRSTLAQEQEFSVYKFELLGLAFVNGRNLGYMASCKLHKAFICWAHGGNRTVSVCVEYKLWSYLTLACITKTWVYDAVHFLKLRVLLKLTSFTTVWFVTFLILKAVLPHTKVTPTAVDSFHQPQNYLM